MKKEEYLKIKKSVIENLDKLIGESVGLSKNIYKSQKDFLLIYEICQTDEELKNLKAKHLKEIEEYEKKYKKLKENLIEIEKMNKLRLLFSKRNIDVYIALKTYKKLINKYN